MKGPKGDTNKSGHKFTEILYFCSCVLPDFLFPTFSLNSCVSQSIFVFDCFCSVCVDFVLLIEEDTGREPGKAWNLSNVNLSTASKPGPEGAGKAHDPSAS